MRMRYKFIPIIMISLLSILAINSLVFADGAEWGTGGGNGSTSGSGNPNNDSYFNCYTIDRCPRWIKVTQEVYQTIIKEKRWHPDGSYTLPDCSDDEYVIIVGNQRNDGSLQIKNFVPEKSAVVPYKSRFTYTSEATSIYKSGITNHTVSGTSDEDRMKKTFMGDKVEGKDYTYYDLLNEIIELSGEKAENIVTFCSSMVESDYYASSKVSVNGSVVANTGIVSEQTSKESSNIYVDTGKTAIKFTHDIYADGEEENVSWSVGKAFKRGSGSISLSGGSGGTTSGTANITTPFTGHDKAKFISTTSPQYEDAYDNKLNLAATYELCESMAVDNTESFLSKVCANIKVPYNFINTASINLGDIMVFAGETVNISINGKVKVNKRKNNEVNKTYATKVNHASIKVVSYLSSSNDTGTDGKEVSGDDICAAIGRTCDNIIDRTDLTLNASENLNGEEKELSSILGSHATTVNVYDAPAGTYYCVAVAVYPASSGSDKMMNSSGSETWYVSSPSCKKIAKKPSIQIWGSGLFTAGDIVVSNAVKHVVKDHLNDYNATNRQHIVFGSWVEQNIVANGLVNIASGASDGLAGDTGRTFNGLNGSYSGSNINQICILSPLTMPNYKCGAMNPGGTSGSMSAPTDKEALLDRFADEDSSRYELHNGVCTLSSAPSFDEKKTHIYRCDGKFTISDDLKVLDTTYSLLAGVPKIIIYSKSDIGIACNVERVDAVLIADGVVDTCDGDEDINSKERSRRLTINGTVIADKLFAKRTYGAATGASSYEPAEIINYDTSLYLWGELEADVTNSGKFETVYQTELPPRY